VGGSPAVEVIQIIENPTPKFMKPGAAAIDAELRKRARADPEIIRSFGSA
jgi:hypothetical protein